MIVSGLCKKGDWRFGASMANYKSGSEAIAQNVQTRIASWRRDWFLDVDACIDWFRLLSERGTKEQIRQEIERVTLETEGVDRVVSVDVTVRASQRAATYTVRYVDVFGAEREVRDANNG